MNSQQNATDYEPTTAEKKLLEALLNPDNRTKNITEICGLAKIDRKTYYKAFKKPEFAALVNDMSRQIVQSLVMSIVHTFGKEAQRGSFQHGKVILEMGGIYTEKKDVNLGGNTVIFAGEDKLED